jgi:hypothetical protein
MSAMCWACAVDLPPEAQLSVRAETLTEPRVEWDAEEPVFAAREESLETNVAPSILDSTVATADDLH